MLSTEKPPTGPYSETSQLISSCKNLITSDERSFDNNKVDLFGFRHGHINQTTPKFSIRDYVFSLRAKDIETHWPFSPKNLHRCLKNGVKNVLPPFVALESLRNPSSAAKYADHEKFSQLNDHLLSGDAKNANQNVASDTRKNSHNPAKNFSSIVKSGKNAFAEQKSNEDFLEITMGSKVCPVCKMFTSSSNTTLNAHIDQCLSGESNSKWMTSSRVVKHRNIRPRNMRLMVDIYETALSCTLEDLDKRNGTNWASSLSDNNINTDINIVHDNNKNEEGDVYFDSNGTKLRILSRSTHVNDVDYNKNGEEDDSRTMKLVERDKASKTVADKKKKKCLVQRHKKLLKSPRFEHRRYSARLERSSEVNHPSKITKKSIIKSHCQQPSLNNKLMTRTNNSRFAVSSNDHNSVSATDQTHKRKESSTSLNSVDEYMPCQTNREGFYSSSSQQFGNDDEDEQNHMIMLPKTNFRLLNESIGPSFAEEDSAACQGNNAKIDSQKFSIDRSKASKIYDKKWGFRFLNSDEEVDRSTYSNHSNESVDLNSYGIEQDISSSLTDTSLAPEFVHEPNLFINDAKGNYSIDVDSIPIPGPPGSFLPSPERMGSEEVRNSSLTNFNIHSLQENGREGEYDSQSSDKSFISNHIPIVERPTPFEHVRVAAQLKIDRPKANCEYPVPSTTNPPILRLMGKNLMVVNREENLMSSVGSQNEFRPFSYNLYQGPPFLDYSNFHSDFKMPPYCSLPISPRFKRDPVFVPQLSRTPESCYRKMPFRGKMVESANITQMPFTGNNEVPSVVMNQDSLITALSSSTGALGLSCKSKQANDKMGSLCGNIRSSSEQHGQQQGKGRAEDMREKIEKENSRSSMDCVTHISCL
ncbi:hapless 8 [Striga hermonthica]|uniref:Hapless 8 n=1 Tax=Striga hermonthica TaxID=68872 RepID=A0A9N7MZA0_STRHE|nr:hapless 8 [Striga hermonthica]